VTDETLRSIQRDLGEAQAQIAEIDRAIARALESVAERVAAGQALDVAVITVLRIERGIAVDKLRVLVRAGEIAGRIARDAEIRARAERFAADSRPQQSVGGTLKPGHKALLGG
jgi:hypothetical protein